MPEGFLGIPVSTLLKSGNFSSTTRERVPSLIVGCKASWRGDFEILRTVDDEVMRIIMYFLVLGSPDAPDRDQDPKASTSPSTQFQIRITRKEGKEATRWSPKKYTAISLCIELN